MKVPVECGCIGRRQPGYMLTAEGIRVPCPYCNGTKVRYESVPDPSHSMSEWTAAAGHFLHWLEDSCTGV